MLNNDGTVNIFYLASNLIHEARHLYDDNLYGRRNPSTIDEMRRTERNACRTEAAYAKAVGYSVYIKDLSGNAILLTSASANIIAERSVKTWVEETAHSINSENLSIDNTNELIDQNNKKIEQYNKIHGTHILIQSHIRRKIVPVYTSPSNY